MLVFPTYQQILEIPIDPVLPLVPMWQVAYSLQDTMVPEKNVLVIINKQTLLIIKIHVLT